MALSISLGLALAFHRSLHMLRVMPDTEVPDVAAQCNNVLIEVWILTNSPQTFTSRFCCAGKVSGQSVIRFVTSSVIVALKERLVLARRQQ